MNFGRRRRIGLLGGSFDPVHVAHLALGQAAITALKLDQLVLIPAGHAWQKGGNQADGRHRLAMLRLAIASLPASTEASHWKIDEQEVNRNGPSYTIDTLKALREHYGPDDALILVLGSDQFRNLDTWHDWQHLLDYAHLAVTQRERVPLSDLPPEIEKLLMAHGTGSLPDSHRQHHVLPDAARSAVGHAAAQAAGRRPAGGWPAADGRGSLHPAARAVRHRHTGKGAGLIFPAGAGAAVARCETS